MRLGPTIYFFILLIKYIHFLCALFIARFSDSMQIKKKYAYIYVYYNDHKFCKWVLSICNKTVNLFKRNMGLQFLFAMISCCCHYLYKFVFPSSSSVTYETLISCIFYNKQDHSLACKSNHIIFSLSRATMHVANISFTVNIKIAMFK